MSEKHIPTIIGFRLDEERTLTWQVRCSCGDVGDAPGGYHLDLSGVVPQVEPLWPAICRVDDPAPLYAAGIAVAEAYCQVYGSEVRRLGEWTARVGVN